MVTLMLSYSLKQEGRRAKTSNIKFDKIQSNGSQAIFTFFYKLFSKHFFAPINIWRAALEIRSAARVVLSSCTVFVIVVTFTLK
jgi:hypothetical protein